MGLSAVFDVTNPNPLRAEHILYTEGNEEISKKFRDLFRKYNVNFDERNKDFDDMARVPHVVVVTDKGSGLSSALWEISGIRGGGERAYIETTHYFYEDRGAKKLESWLKHYTEIISKSKS